MNNGYCKWKGGSLRGK